MDDISEEGDREGDDNITSNRNQLFGFVKQCCLPALSFQGDKLLRNRMKVCVLAICLMWATSLKVAVFITSFFIEVPALDLIHTSCKNAFSLTRDERDRYIACVDAQLGRCNWNLDATSSNEALRINASGAWNDRILKMAKSAQSDCSSAHTSLRYSLESWAAHGQAVPLKNTTCDAEERNKLTSMVGDLNAVRSEAFSLSAEYSDESQSTVRRLADYADARTSYDAEYIDNHTQIVQEKLNTYVRGLDVPLLDLSGIFDGISANVEKLVSCVSLRSVDDGECEHFDGTQEILADIRVAVNERMQTYAEELERFHLGVEVYKRSVLDAYEISKRFYVETKSSVEKYKLHVFFKGEWFDVPVESFLPENVEFPSSIPTFDPLPSLDYVWDSVYPSLVLFRTALALAAQNAAREAQLLQFNVRTQVRLEKPDLTPSDYNPPRYVGSSDAVTSVSGERLIHGDRSKNFIERSAIALDAFSELTQAFAADGDVSTETGGLFSLSGMKNKLSNVNISFEQLKSPDIDFDFWFIQLNSLGDIMFLLDFAFRTYCTARLVVKYWSVTSVEMPDVDLRKRKRTINPLKMSYTQLAASIFTNPLIGVAVCALFGFWLVSVAYAIYYPLYNDYVSGCVPTMANGTFMTKNIFSMAYNHAYQDGSSVLVEGLELFDTERGQICSSLYTSSAAKQNERNTVFSGIKNVHNTTLGSMDMLQRCIDSDILDAEFRGACCGLEGYQECDGNVHDDNICPINELSSAALPFLPPSTYLNEDACVVNMSGKDWEMMESVFDCSKLPSCDVTCTGPHKEKIRTVATECGCTVEWIIHSMWLQGTVALIIFACINASRIGILEGLARVLWKKLHPDWFTILITCDQNGEIIPQNEDEMSNSPSVEDCLLKGAREELGGKIDRKAKWFQISGVAMIFFALCVNFPWMYVLCVGVASTKPQWMR